MSFTPLPFDAPLRGFERQADELLTAWKAKGEQTLRLIGERLPRFRKRPFEEVKAAEPNAEEARFALARAYDFADWQALTEFQAAASKPGSEVHRFETAIEATVDGDLAKLSALVQADTGL